MRFGASRFWCVAVGLVALSLLDPVTARAAELWRAYTYSQAATLMAPMGLARIFDDVNKRTNGELRIRLNIGGSLPINATNILEAVAENTVQLGDDAFFVGSIPISGVLQMPILFKTEAEFEEGLAVMRPVLTSELDKKGLVLLGAYTYPVNVVWSRKKLTSVHDLEGQRIRVISPEQAKFVGSFGATPITMGSAELAAALDRGVIDGVTTATIGSGRFLKDVLKYRLNLNLNFVTSLVYANKGAWEKLSPDMQKAIQAAMNEGLPKITADMAGDEDKATAGMVHDGLVVTDLSAQDAKEVADKAAKFWDEWGQQHSEADRKVLSQIRSKLGR